MTEIKISDLSIGDWVRMGGGNLQIYHLTLAGDVYGYRRTNDSDTGEEYYDGEIGDVQPIPLTPEILEKNGFVIVDESADFQLYGSPECSIFFTKGTVRYRLETPQASVVCWNVHQLQHALRLAGVEKEIEV